MATLTNSSDEDWKKLGESDPYFAVLTEPEYHKENLSSAARQRFFESGAEHVAKILGIIRDKLDPSFAPKHALDFGCGVGRILIPLARVCPHVTGVDVSEAMLAEASRNVAEAGLNNVELVCDGSFEKVTGSFDFIHSYIVLQHIPVKRGEEIIGRLLDRLGKNGCAMIHVTYRHPMPPLNKALYWTRVRVPGAHRLLNVALGRSPSAPLMQGNDYSLTRVVEIAAERGCHEAHVRLSDHHGARGALFFFRKSGIALF